MTRWTVRGETVHFCASVGTLGQQTPRSSAVSASAIKMSLGVGDSSCFQAQFMAAMLTAVETAPLVLLVGHDASASDRAVIGLQPRR